jgi:hypothetical protein
VLDAFKGHLTPEDKSVICAMNTGPCGHTWRDNFSALGFRCCSE